MEGSRIGQYRVLRLLGEGGMGRVLLVEHVVMGSRHALKMLHPEMSANDAIVQRFLNEARAASAIGHRNVVEISHVDQLEGGGPWYLVMKYFEGQTLADLLRAQGVIRDQRLVLHIVAEALNGLQAAHDRRIIHRDLKPDNLFLTSAKGDPYRVVLLDFGVAQLGHDARVVTRTGTVIGTPQYMPAEQHRGAEIDYRADIFALGAIVYEMVTGRLPYEDDASQRNVLTGAEIFHRMMTRAIVDPRQLNPSLTESFARAVLKALAVEPGQRHASARDFALRLAEATPGGMDILRQHADELLERSAASSLPLTGPDTPTLRARPAPLSTLGAGESHSAKELQPRRFVRLALSAAVLAAVVIAVLVMRSQSAPSSEGVMQPREASLDAPGLDARLTPMDARVDAPVDAHADAPVDARPEAPSADARIANARESAPRPALRKGTLRVVVLPWAEVWVDGKSYGQTPRTIPLVEGTHRLQLKNDTTQRVLTVKITADKTTEIEQSW